TLSFFVAPITFAVCCFFDQTSTPDTYTLSLHDALPIFIDFDFKALALANIAYPVYTQASKRTDNSLSLRVEDFCLGHDIDNNTRSEEHTSELQSRFDLVCRLLLEKKNKDFRIQAYPGST